MDKESLDDDLDTDKLDSAPPPPATVSPASTSPSPPPADAKSDVVKSKDTDAAFVELPGKLIISRITRAQSMNTHRDVY